LSTNHNAALNLSTNHNAALNLSTNQNAALNLSTNQNAALNLSTNQNALKFNSANLAICANDMHPCTCEKKTKKNDQKQKKITHMHLPCR
jgi:hypothetical protein